MADGIGAEWFNALDDYVQGIEEAVSSSQEVAAETLYDSVVERARNTQGWDMLADNIETWSRDGALVIGVQRPGDGVSGVRSGVRRSGRGPQAPVPHAHGRGSESAGDAMQDHLGAMLGDRYF